MARLLRQRQARGYTVGFQDSVWSRDAEGRTRISGNRYFEVDTYTCLHCQRIVDKPPFKCATDDGIGAWCYTCNGAICLHPECQVWHQNGKMSAREFLDAINEKHAQIKERERWS